MAAESSSILLSPTTGFVIIALGLVVLLTAIYQAKTRNFNNHRNLMLLAAGVNALFLVQYVSRFLVGQHTVFAGPVQIRNFVYIPILTVHIITAIITIGLVVTHLKRSLGNEVRTDKGRVYFEKDYRSDHRSFGRITFLFWATSFVGGIIVFLLLYVLYA